MMPTATTRRRRYLDRRRRLWNAAYDGCSKASTLTSMSTTTPASTKLGRSFRQKSEPTLQVTSGANLTKQKNSCMDGPSASDKHSSLFLPCVSIKDHYVIKWPEKLAWVKHSILHLYHDVSVTTLCLITLSLRAAK